MTKKKNVQAIINHSAKMVCSRECWERMHIRVMITSQPVTFQFDICSFNL